MIYHKKGDTSDLGGITLAIFGGSIGGAVVGSGVIKLYKYNSSVKPVDLVGGISVDILGAIWHDAGSSSSDSDEGEGIVGAIRVILTASFIIGFTGFRISIYTNYMYRLNNHGDTNSLCLLTGTIVGGAVGYGIGDIYDFPTFGLVAGGLVGIFTGAIVNSIPTSDLLPDKDNTRYYGPSGQLDVVTLRKDAYTGILITELSIYAANLIGYALMYDSFFW